MYRGQGRDGWLIPSPHYLIQVQVVSQTEPGAGPHMHYLDPKTQQNQTLTLAGACWKGQTLPTSHCSTMSLVLWEFRFVLCETTAYLPVFCSQFVLLRTSLCCMVWPKNSNVARALWESCCTNSCTVGLYCTLRVTMTSLWSVTKDSAL